MDDKLIVGCIGAAQGLQGWVRLTSYTSPPSNIFNYSPWWLQKSNDWATCEITDHKITPKGLLLIKLATCNDREQAKYFTNTRIGINKNQLPTLSHDEYYWTDLQGLTVFTESGLKLGIVDHLLATGANDVLIVKDDSDPQKTLAIPYLDHTINQVNLADKTLIVRWDPDF